MDKTMELGVADWKTKYSNPELQIRELFRNYNISTELIRKTTNLEELLDLILQEYIERFDEIPGVDLVNVDKMDNRLPVREKLRSLIMFASQAVLLKENAEIFRELERKTRQLEKKTEELKKANQELEQLNHQYLNMLGFVSHELRSPLISILGFAELLDEELLGPLNDEQRKSVQVIIRSSQTLIDMIKNYLDLARIEQGEMRVEKRKVNLYADVLTLILEEMAEQFERKELTVIVEGEEQDAVVPCDPALIRIVFTNLLSNAVKYSKEGGLVRIRFEPKEEELEVSVYNTGPGLPKSQLKNLFKKFTRIDEPSRHEMRSSGLGLYNAKFIVEKHGGKIWADAEKGKWFCVYFTLPYEEETVGAEEDRKNGGRRRPSRR
jgi:signal transduction histidine kinase